MSNTSNSDTMLSHMIPDAAMRERLLDKSNLEFLASLYDFEPQVLEHMFANGMRLEDLLLELLKREPDPRTFIVQLDLRENEAQSHHSTTSAAAEAPYLARLQEMVPDATMREKLLDIENLAFLIPLYDFEERDVKNMTQRGMTPVDVLLALLKKEPDPRRLIVQLKLRDAEALKKPGPQPEKNKTTPSTSSPKPPLPLPIWWKPLWNTLRKRLAPMVDRIRRFCETYHLAIIALGIVCTVEAALSVTGFHSLISRSVSEEALTLFAVLGGVIMGASAVKYFQSYSVSILLGVIGNVGILWTMLFYLHGRERILTNELVIPGILGCLPAFGLYYIFFRKPK